MIRKGRMWSWLIIVTLTIGLLSGCSKQKEVLDSPTSEEEMTEGQEEVLQGENEDPDSNLGPWGRAMGSVLIAINEGSPYYFGGYAVSDANQEAAANILEQSWDIHDRKELLKQIQFLLQTGSRKEYLREAKEMDALSKKKLKQAMKQLTGPLLIHYQQLQNNWETWGKKGLVAWDMCRISHLVQWGYIAGYLDVKEAQAMIEPAAQILREQFTSWDDVITNWLDGYAFTAGIDPEEPENDYEKRQQVYQELQEAQEEKGLLYDDSLFQTQLIPLSDISYQDLFKEIKEKTDKGKKKDKKEQTEKTKTEKKQQETESEDKKE